MIVTLRLFFFGLMAFVQQPNQLTVVLVDATQQKPAPTNCKAEVSQCPFHVHTPLLVTWSAPSCLDDTSFPGLCSWDLTKQEIDLPPVQAPSGLHYASTRHRNFWIFGPKTSLPGSMSEAADFSWVPEMNNVLSSSATIAPGALSISGPYTISDVSFSNANVQACHLAELDTIDEPAIEGACNKKCIHTFRFMTLDGDAQSSPLQTLADGVMISFDVRADADGSVTLRLKQNGQAVKLAPRDCVIKGIDKMCVDVAVTNMPPHSDACPAVGMDFALLYLLSNQVPDICKRPVPHRTTETTSALRLPECDSQLVTTLFNLMSPSVSPESRPVCPMVTFGG